jgi:hypothetical protein
MTFREVIVVQVKEAVRRWMRGKGERPMAIGAGVDRKTARRYITVAVELGVDRTGGQEQLTDELIGQLVERCGGSRTLATQTPEGIASRCPIHLDPIPHTPNGTHGPADLWRCTSSLPWLLVLLKAALVLTSLGRFGVFSQTKRRRAS